MKKILPILTIVITAIVLSACIPQTSQTQSNTTTSTNNKELTSQNPASQSQNYVEYTPTIVRELTNQNKKVVLFFHATWCPTCKAANEDILSRLSEIPENIVIVKTDYDTYPELKEQYNITYQHTFVQVDSDGNQIIIWNGGDLDEIIAKVK